MRVLIQKLPIDNDRSFVAQTFRTPNFEVGWHRHPEVEIILFTEGMGLSFVGNHVGEFEAGDIYLLGSNLPHSFQKRAPGVIASAIVVQFLENFWGDQYLKLPECNQIRKLLDQAGFGLKIENDCKHQLSPIIKELETAQGFRRVLLLGMCLDMIASSGSYREVATLAIKPGNQKEQEMLDRIFRYTAGHFQNPITLNEIAGIACLTVPAFCNYFKKRTKKTYIDFLNEVRISHACTLLQETKKNMLEIGGECGYTTIANFHKQFRKIKKISPLQYRKQFITRLSVVQNNIGIIQE
jgi:AraC-like DNA-binding protein